MPHRPDLELRRLTPGNKDELLFDDVLRVERTARAALLDAPRHGDDDGRP
ncbi:MAG TPA: hypothetical protein VHA76_10950 [Solirubrobacterales bacterium]|nr:hypothetical protein [Solirubrobacterales bacterium]